MRAWQDSLGGAPPAARIYQPGAGRNVTPRPDESRQPFRSDAVRRLPTDDDEDPEISVANCLAIVPRRRGAGAVPPSFESFWSSHLFWKGIVVGAVAVLLAKTAISVRAPYGIDWYGF